VTFLFTDIEGSTRRWESDPDSMRSALTVHDEMLGSAIDAHGGWLFKHTGDGVCAAFGSARAAIDAAVEAQQTLALPVRMGVATGEAERRGEDYFGPVLNRAARVMTAGHGGQILVAASTAAVVSGAELVDRGEHRLRDLSGVEHLYQVQATGLRVEFPPLRTLDAVPGNLPVQTTSFIGRDVAVKELCEHVRAHRLVTLTGVGGVGKTRLAVQVAAELVSEFPDGVWLVELAPVGEPGALADVVATVLGVTPQAGVSMTASLIQALSGRRLLLVLDNCEHLLDAAADLVEQLLTHTTTVRVITTSREGLRVGAEQLWSVPSLDVRDGVASAGVALFVERAQAVNPGFGLDDEADSAAVTEICGRLDGIALAIELAAARMVSMSAQDVRDRLGDRFRLLSGSRRGLERHQTLRHAVQWSYDLLGDDERTVLQRCSVFAGGFDLAASTAICEHSDEYAVLDVLDSLVRKSLITVERVDRHARYGMLETIRQFAEEQLAATGHGGEVRDRHARFYAEQAATRWAVWDGPGYRAATEWVEDEFSNLRAGFRWAADKGDVVTAATIAAHTTMLTAFLQLHEPAGWAEEILDVATANDVAQLPLLYTAASVCSLTGRPEAGVAYASAAVALTADSRYETSDAAWIRFMEGSAHRYAGRPERYVEICAELAARPGAAHVVGLCGLLAVSPEIGRSDEARAIADQTLTAAHAHGNPVWIALALTGSGRAFAGTDPDRALSALRQGLVYARQHRLPYFEALLAREAAVLETVYGPLEQALTLFDSAIDSFHRAGLVVWVATLLADLAVLFDRVERPEVAATCYGAATHQGGAHQVPNLPAAVDHLRAGLGEEAFDGCVAVGAAMEIGDAVRYARDQTQTARRQLADLT
jgi:predicted ATPase